MPNVAEHKPTTCTSCQAPIFWARTAKGILCPYDAAEVQAAERVYVYMPDLLGQMQRVESGTGHQSHFATCPNASQHSRKA